MTAKNIITSIDEGCPYVVILGDSDDMVLCETREAAATYVFKMRRSGFTGKVVVLDVKKIYPLKAGEHYPTRQELFSP